MSWKHEAMVRTAPVLDRVMGPLVWASARMMLLLRQMTPRNAPRSFGVLDRVGIYPLMDHYYEPLIKLSRIGKSLDEPRVIPGLEVDAEAGLRLLESLDPFAEMHDIPVEPRPGPRAYHYRNSFFGPLDAAALHAMIRRHRPRRIVEVGCGMSTLLALRAEAMNGAGSCEHVCIEPYEAPWLAELPVRLVRATAESADVALIESLEADDILFIDSSHMIRPQGDVLTEVLDWLGRLKPGVVVHIHDVFTPRDYPIVLLRDHRFFWNEQYLVEAFLAFNQHFEVLLPMYHMYLSQRDRLIARCPVQADPRMLPPTSFWFRRTS